MATQYLIEGANSFAAAFWSGAGFTSGDDMVIDVPFSTITSNLDQSGLSEGVESLNIKSTASGTIGGGSSGSLKLDADNSADAYVANYGQVTLYLEANGDDNLVNNFSCGPGSTNYLTGGSFGEIVVDGGFLNVNESTTITGDVFINSGIVVLEYNATDAAKVQVNGGTVTLHRVPDELIINGGTVTLDPDDDEDYTSKSIQQNGGTLYWRAGAIPSSYLDGGVCDFRNNSKGFTPGATEALTSSACKIYRHPDVDLSNFSGRGSSKVDVGGATPFPG